MATRKNRHYFLVKITGTQTIRLPTKARNARSPVVLTRKMADIMAGTEGMAVTCANAQCALRENGNAFPHAAYMVEFTDNRAYVVDKLDKRGVPISCVVYAHNEGAFQKNFDKKGKRLLAKMSGIEKSFVLSPPPEQSPAGMGKSRSGPSGSTYAQREAKKKGMSKGAIARAQRAGINLQLTKAA